MRADFLDDCGLWVARGGRDADKTRFWTRSGQTWHNMIYRCKSKIQPRYFGCSVSENFKHYQYFAQWCQNQIGYGLDKYELDKDILVPGNKIYSEDTCAFVPSALNNFFVDNKARRGAFPKGVHFHDLRCKFTAVARLPNGKFKQGFFNTAQEAYLFYKNSREDLAKQWAEKIINKEIIADPRVAEALRIWVVPNEE